MDQETYGISHQIIRVADAQGAVSWMLFTEERKIVRTDGGRKPSAHGDEINIKLHALGSFQKDVREGEKRVMEMRGYAFSMDSTVNFSDGYIVVEEPWKEMRIGTFMMNYLVSWATAHYPEYQPVGIRLSLNQAHANNKDRRNRFYDCFGFKFIWEDAGHEEGKLDLELRVRDLRTTDKWEDRIKVFSVEEGLKEMFSESRQLRMDCLDAQYRAKSAIEALRRAEARVAQALASKPRWGLAGMVLASVIFVSLGRL